jgi:plastocyanin
MLRTRICGMAFLIVAGIACGADDAGTPVASGASQTQVVTSTPSSPAPSPSAVATTCKEAKAVDLSSDDPFTIRVRNFKFTPNCFIASADNAIAIENTTGINHTFSIDGTLVNAPLRPHHTYKHSGGGGFLTSGTAYPFHCSIHPQMTGTWFVV